jgi:adenylate cyclase
MTLSSDETDSQLDPSRARAIRRTALVVMLSSLACLVIIVLLLWHLVANRMLSAWNDPAMDPARGAPALAVLPFESAPDARPLGTDIASDLIARLSRLGHLRVARRDESFAYRSGAVDAKRVGRALRVRYVVDGRVSRIDGRIRLRVRVFDARTARPVWTEDREVEPAELAAAQQRLARRITSAVLGDAGPAL